MSASRVFLGLVSGFLLGLALAAAPQSISSAIVSIAAPVGTIFVSLIRMTVVPLVVSMLVASVGSMAASGLLGRTGLRAAVVAVALLVIAAVGSLVVARPVLARIRIDQPAALALRAAASPAESAAVPAQGFGTTQPPGAPPTPGLAQWLVDLVPQNPIKAAADGAMLPLIVFSVLFALSLSRVADARREPVLEVVRGVADAMQRLVSGLLEFAPVGVFALAVPLASRLGLAAAGAVLAYVVLVVALTVAALVLLLYPAGIVGGRMSPSSFVSLCAPPQAVAFASRSSLAALPAMVEAAEHAGMPPVVTGFLLPLSASVFRVGGAVAQTVGVLFLAQLYGVNLTAAQLAAVVFTVILTTFSVPGIPGGSIIAMVPVLLGANVPVDGIGILLAVDTVPDMFRTTANVTGSLTLAALLRRSSLTSTNVLVDTDGG